MAFLQIIVDNILPLLVFVVIGYFLDKKFHLDVSTVTKLTVNIVLPGFIFYSIYVAKLDMTMFHVFLLSAALMVIMGILGEVIGHLFRFPLGKIQAFKNGIMFSNSGNIGIALIGLVFTNPPFVVNGEMPYFPAASAAAAMILVEVNMGLHSLGLYQAGIGKLTPKEALSAVFRIPVIYTLVIAFIIKYSGFDMTKTFLWPAFEICAAALAAIVMIALGMQIHKSSISFRERDAWIASFLRLIGSPLLALLLIYLWKISGMTFPPEVAQTILIMCAVPAAVNSVLYAVEFHNCEDFATSIVMMSTILSAITLPLAIYGARLLFPV